MPLVTANPRGQQDGSTRTQFTDTTNTSSVTYTYPTTQSSLIIENSGERDIFVTVGTVTNQVIQVDKKWRYDGSFTLFSIRSDVNSQEFIATAIYQVVEDFVSLTTQLAERATKDEVALKADKTYVDQVKSGTPKIIKNTLAELNSTYPTGSTDLALVIGNVKEVASLTVSSAPTTAGNVTVTLNGVATNIAVTSGVKEVASLTVTAVPTAIGNVTITLNGVATTVALDPATDTTTDLVATKIRNATYSTGAVTGGTSSTVTFTASAVGVKTDATYSAGSTSATGTMSTTTQGVDADTTTTVATKIRGTAFSGWTTGGTGTTITFTASVAGVKTSPSYSAGTTGTTGSISVTTAGVNADGNWYYWNGTAWTAGGLYQANSSVVQTTGSSDSQVMSQKATTNEILKNSINIKEITRKSFNLFNPNTSISNTAMDVDGSLFTAAGYYVSDYIKLNGKNISGNWLSSASTPHLAVYDKDFTFLRTVVPTSQTYTYQSGDYYARAGFRTSATDVSIAMINYGNTLLAYKPYREKNTSISNVIFAGTQNGCDYATIQDALNAITDDSATNPYIIYVMPGTYARFSMIDIVNRLHYISIIGFDRTTTIIKSDTGTYETPPAEIWTNGTIENLTFLMQTNAGTYTGVGGQLQAYAVHQDFGACETLYKNCVMQSNAGPAGGFGMYENGKMRFHDCDFISDGDNTWGTNTLGAMFIHTNSMTPDLNQYAEFRNCNAINKYGTDGFRLRIPTGAGGSYAILMQNCLSWGASGASAFVNPGILDPKSFGNNVVSLNA